MGSNELPRTAAIEEIELKICVVCDGTVDVGELRGCLPGYKTSAEQLSDMSENFLGMLYLAV
jgi:hypothetical protein